MILDKSVVSPVTVGRDDDLQQLDRLLSHVLDGKGQVVLVSGEAGVGKSRIANEAADRGLQRNLTVLRGTCFQTDSAQPYAPLLDLLRNYLASHSHEEIRKALGASTPHLVRIVPEIGRYFPEVHPAPNPEPKLEKIRTIQSVTQAFSDLARDEPLVIIIEDLHWSDATSLEFLLALTRRLSPLRIFLLLTYRSEETNPELTHFLAELERGRIGTEINLKPLAVTDVDIMLRAILDLATPVSQEFLDAVYPLTEGNPFFIEEILKALMAEGDVFYANGAWDRKEISQLRIPRTIQDAVQRRTRKLDGDSVRALAMASVLGRRFDFRLLRELLQCDEADLVGWIKQLVNAQLIVEESADAFAFRHALTREAAYSTMMLRERQGLHRLVGEAMERLYAESIHSHYADLSYHFFNAEDWQKALTYSLKAGDQACELYAPREAIVFYSRAFVAARELDLGIDPTLLSVRGRAYETLGDFKSAQDDFEQALKLAREARDGQAEWQAMIDLGQLWSGRDYQRTGEYLREAEAVSEKIRDPRLHAQSLNRLGNWHVNIGQTGQGLSLHLKALEIFKKEKDVRGMADSFDLLGMARMHDGDLFASFTEYQHAIKHFRDLDDKYGLVSALTGTCNTVNWNETSFIPDLSSGERHRLSLEALDLTRQTGWAPGEAFIEWTIALNQASRGLFSDAIGHASESLRIATEIGHRQWVVGAQNALGYVHLLMLEADAAIHWFDLGLAFAKKLGSAWWTGNLSANLAGAYLLNKDPEKARAVLDSEMRADQKNTLAGQRLQLTMGNLLLMTGKPREALRIAEGLLALRTGKGGIQPIPHVLKLKGEALAALKQGEKALPILIQAKQGAMDRDNSPLLWQIHSRLGWLHKDLKDNSASETEFDEARRLLKILEGNIHDEPQKEEFIAYGLEFLPKEKVLTKRQSDAEKFGGLTAREREVARYLAQGKSNREIAGVLVLSERTVENHVQNILNKLGFDSRSQAAVWAAEKGLV